ncbi:MAG: AMMECR1 domain-containing protein [Spirochaetes bacterium]|nr:AMMECR1 domain-containing protein [Spirochaetota bacterium]
MIGEIKIEDKKLLLKAAKDAIWAKLAQEDIPTYYKDRDIYNEKAGVIIKLMVKEKIRGYISEAQSQAGILDTIQKVAINSAFYDPRFDSLKKEEWDDLRVVLYIVKDITELKNLKALNPTQDGLLVKSPSNSAILLPDDVSGVPMTPEGYMKEAALKAGSSFQSSDLKYFLISFIKLTE